MKKNNPTHPVLYTFRRCPYAIRARMALSYSKVQVEIKEIMLSNRPSELFAVSPKGTVPVLCINSTTVIDESLDIMKWALIQNDPNLRELIYDYNSNNELLFREFIESKIDISRIGYDIQVCLSLVCDSIVDSSDNIYVDSVVSYDLENDNNYLVRLYLWYNT